MQQKSLGMIAIVGAGLVAAGCSTTSSYTDYDERALYSGGTAGNLPYVEIGPAQASARGFVGRITLMVSNKMGHPTYESPGLHPGRQMSVGSLRSPRIATPGSHPGSQGVLVIGAHRNDPSATTRQSHVHPPAGGLGPGWQYGEPSEPYP